MGYLPGIPPGNPQGTALGNPPLGGYLGGLPPGGTPQGLPRRVFPGDRPWGRFIRRNDYKDAWSTFPSSPSPNSWISGGDVGHS